MRILAVLTGLLFTTLASAAGTPTTLAIAAGNNQSATAGTAVSGVVCVIVKDASNNPVGGVSVTWSVASGGGSITGATQTTAGNGVATLGSWTLGATPGPNSLTCTSTGLNTVTFDATGTGSAPSKLFIAAGNNQSALVGTAVSGPVCVSARDAQNNPVSGVVVTFGNVTGGGSITSPIQITDGSGIAQLGSWTLGASPGANTLTATAAGLNTLTFTATAVVEPGDENAVLRWNSATLRAIQSSGAPPTVAARAIAMVHTAMFDAWAAYDPKALGTRLGGKLRRPASEQTDANKTIAVSYAAYRVLVDLFAAQKASFDTVMAGLSLDPSDKSTDTTTPIGIGNTTGAEILAFRHNDGANQLGDRNPGAYSDYTSYQPKPGDVNHWQPQTVNGAVQTFDTPQWGLVTPFAIGSQAKRKNLMPKGAATSLSKNYATQATAVLALSAALTDQAKVSAEYWADGPFTITPAGHACTLAQFISQRDSHALDADVKLFFALGNTLLDVSIEVWDTKTHVDAERPITGVRSVFAGKTVQAWAGPGLGTQSIAGETWSPYIPTPASAEFVSEQSAFAAASVQVLASFTKKSDFNFSVTIPAASSQIDPAVPAQAVTLTFAKFTDAANAAGLAGQYGGIQFKDGDLLARKLGKKIGTVVYKTALQYILGKIK